MMQRARKISLLTSSSHAMAAADAASATEVREAARKAAVRLGYKQLKEEQVKVVEAYISGRDVFAVLPTGFGKSLCFACLPFVLEEFGHEKPIVIRTSTL